MEANPSSTAEKKKKVTKGKKVSFFSFFLSFFFFLLSFPFFFQL